MISPERALAGREHPKQVTQPHAVLGTSLLPPFPEGTERAIFAMGCFWGAERTFWQLDGVYATAAGYSGGVTENPTYEEVCSHRTGHAECVLCVFRPAKTSYAELLRVFFEAHDPTQGMRQGNDVGTQYRSAVYATSPAQLEQARDAAARYGALLGEAGYGALTTEVSPAETFYYAEEWHQQYLAKNPDGYCGIEGTGVSCPVGLARG